MTSSRVLSFPRSDRDSASVLVHVASVGKKPLDLKLLATEGEAPYVCLLKHDRVASLRVKNCPVSETEWEHILLALLQQEPVEGIQAAANIQPDSSICLTIRKQVQGITQRLGAISLACDQAERIELFQWCELSLDALDRHKTNEASLAAQIRVLDSEVEQLRAQLEELVQAKQDDETALLLKCRDLLNEKKAKIREQQKTIAASPFTGSGASSLQPLQATDVHADHLPDPSGPKKRKAKSVQLEEESHDQVDHTTKTEYDASEPGADDTDPGDTSDAAMSTADELDEGEPAQASVAHGDKPAASPQNSRRQQRQQQDPPPPPKKTTKEPPPRRNLPFASANKQTTAAPPTAEETESDDDEL